MLEHGAITEAQHDKSLHDLTMKMGYGEKQIRICFSNKKYDEAVACYLRPKTEKKMIGVPKFLNQYTSDEKQKGTRLSFKLKCTCGCETFSIIKNSFTAVEKRLQKEYEEKMPNTGWHTIYGGLDTNGKPYSYIKRFFFFKKHIVFPQEPVSLGIYVIKATCSRCKKEFTIFDSRYNGYDSQFSTEEQKAYVPHFENSKEKVGNISIVMEQYDEEDVAPEHFSRIQIFVLNGDKKHKFFDAETG